LTAIAVSCRGGLSPQAGRPGRGGSSDGAGSDSTLVQGKLALNGLVGALDRGARVGCPHMDRLHRHPALAETLWGPTQPRGAPHWPLAACCSFVSKSARSGVRVQYFAEEAVACGNPHDGCLCAPPPPRPRPAPCGQPGTRHPMWTQGPQAVQRVHGRTSEQSLQTTLVMLCYPPTRSPCGPSRETRAGPGGVCGTGPGRAGPGGFTDNATTAGHGLRDRRTNPHAALGRRAEGCPGNDVSS
jgi:hypothetical protein